METLHSTISLQIVIFALYVSFFPYWAILLALPRSLQAMNNNLTKGKLSGFFSGLFWISLTLLWQTPEYISLKYISAVTTIWSPSSARPTFIYLGSLEEIPTNAGSIEDYRWRFSYRFLFLLRREFYHISLSTRLGDQLICHCYLEGGMCVLMSIPTTFTKPT
jgi:hypothetical protein